MEGGEMIDGLKPCPFCGGEAAFHEHERVGVECIECGAGFACVYRDRDEAADEWNRRSERTCRIKLSKTSAWHCDGCGQTLDSNCFADNGGRLTEYRYCPNCGARVMDE